MKRIIKIILIEFCFGILPIIVGTLWAKYDFNKRKARDRVIDV